jgi:tetratricopeptide (TPR) repeat protein
MAAGGRFAAAAAMVRPVAPTEPPSAAIDRLIWSQARCDLGEFLRSAGETEASAAAFGSARDVATEADAAALAIRTQVAAGLARLAQDTGRSEDACRFREEAVALADQTHSANPSPGTRTGQARERSALAGALAAAGRPAAAEPQVRRAFAAVLGPGGPPLSSPATQRELGVAERAAAAIAAAHGDHASAIELGRRSAARGVPPESGPRPVPATPGGWSR